MTKSWVPVQIPLAAGLDTKSDLRAKNAPLFEILKDAEFENPGGLQTRKPYGDLGINIQGGGQLADIRRLVENGNELLCFTKQTLYSWSPSLAVWIPKGTHLAVIADEETTFGTTGDQVNCDRAELAGTIVYTWTDAGGAYCAALDANSGAVVMPPTSFGAPTSRPRLVALTTKILLLFYDGVNGLYAYALDPANPAAALAGASTTVTNVAFGIYYDVVRIAATDAAAFVAAGAPTTSYVMGTIAASLVVTKVTKARTCDGAIAISIAPSGTRAQIVRGNGSNVQGDLIDLAGLADIAVNQAIGTAAGVGASVAVQIACAHRSVQDAGAYRCYVFWSGPAGTSGAPVYGTKYNWVDTNGVLGAQAYFGASGVDTQCGLASRAFGYNGSVFVWLVFSGTSSTGTSPTRIALENTFFLFRDDIFLCAKIAPGTAGGAPASTSCLPGVALVSGETSFAWCGTRRRIVPLGGESGGYGARAPQDITFAFDSNAARRCARLGATMYISGGEVLQYDGLRLVEVGFHVYPWYLIVAATTGVGSIANGTYAYKSTYRWDNAVGETDRSTTATFATVVMAGGPGHFDVTLLPITATHKHIANCSPAKEVWRTPVNPEADTPFYLVTSRDPAAPNPNGYVTVDQFTMADHLADAALTVRELDPETGGTLESIAPPAAKIVIASADRVFLAGIAGDPHRVWYSRLRGDGEVASFHDGNVVALPSYAGPITGLGLLNETLIAFTADAIYALDGQGYNNVGGGLNYGPARLLSQDVGAVSHESIAFTPGGLVFKSQKGWYLLNRGWAVDYIGAPVAAYDAEEIVAVHLLETQHQIRCLSSSRMLVLDYVLNQWSEWTVAGGVGAAMFRGAHHVATGVAVKAQRSDYVGIDFGIDAKLAPIKLNDLQGAGSVRWLDVLGEYRGACRLEVSLFRDYESVAYQTETWTVDPTAVGEPLQISVGPQIPKCMAIGVRLRVLGPVTDTPTTEAVKLTGLALEVGIDRGINRRMGATQKT